MYAIRSYYAELRRIAQDPVSLEMPLGEEEDSTLGDFVEDTDRIVGQCLFRQVADGELHGGLDGTRFVRDAVMNFVTRRNNFV